MVKEIAHFESFEQAQRYLRAQIQAADARVQPWQAAIRPHECFRQDSGYGFAIYGKVMEEEQERPSHLRHFRFCHCYSEACPDGELHVSVIERVLSGGQFEEARARGWQP